jgi:hydroxyacyl-ACP dehydratase HTD2-like protein with hotdog domain
VRPVPIPFDDLTPDQELLAEQRTPDAMDLFLFSAAIWLPHRIHYDQPYTTEEEGHPALLVHGPLQAVYLSQLLSGHFGPAATLARFTYRHETPVYLGATLTCRGRVTTVDRDARSAECEVWTELEDGRRTTVGQATLSFA